MRAVGNRVATDEWFVATGKVELKREILAGFEGGQRFAVVRLEVERADVVALGGFFGDGEFARAVPDEPGLLDLLAAEFGFLNLQSQAFQRGGLLRGFEAEAAQRAEDFERE